MLGRTDSRRRLLFLLGVFLIGVVALVARTAYWQVVRADWLMVRAVAQTTVTSETPGRRGEIYDRTGVVLLATTVDRDRLVASADQIAPTEIDPTARTLVRLLGLDAAGEVTLRERLESGKPYVILARGIDPKMADRIRQAARDGRIFGISLESEPERVYPQVGGGPESSLAAHLLGFVNRESIGQYGVEQFYQDELAGRPRVTVSQRDSNGRIRPETTETTQTGVAGEDLRLTIDASLQLAVEQELLAAWVADKAKSVSAVVMDPYTGEIYAQATYPSYDANHYRAVAAADPSRFIDPIVSHVYEPGSVFKMMTAAVALESGTVTPKTKIKDIGTLKLDNGKSKIDNANRKGMGWITFEDGIAYSRNVVAAKVALQLGDTTRDASAALYDEWRRLGFGSPTGIDLAGEVSGLVRDPGLRAWSQIDLANGSSTTSGSGKPVAIHGQRLMYPALDPPYASLGGFGIGGKWIAGAKVTAFAGPAVQCRLRDSLDSDESFEEHPDYGHTMALQIASTGLRRTLSIQCRDHDVPTPNEPYAGEVQYVKVTALKLGSLIFRSLTP